MGSAQPVVNADRSCAVYFGWKHHDFAARFHQEGSENAQARSGLDEAAFEKITECIMKRNPHTGSDFDDFLKEENILDETQAVAVKRVLSFQLEQSMKKSRLTKSAMAKRMGTTRAQLDRLLNPENPSTTLTTVVKAAVALGKRVKISFEAA